ncbi:hypothetical protein CYMTET_13282 [Cymbomonas tetramitiformis]|uniref:Flavanone 4-reductase n=1 Tax=Cymbomonas tetramitiformis TaxID=36881 RepID=A0AAE0LBC6_9CHLO|nr:hypothetical protein CYMTET_13282 [Cymbomonas tetramitiformis]
MSAKFSPAQPSISATAYKRQQVRVTCTAEKPAVAVTGANSFIGTHLVKQLLAKGYPVHATVRDVNDDSKTDPLRALPGASNQLRLFEADMTSPSSLEPAFEGISGIFHLAVPHPNHGGTPEINSDYRQELLDAAVQGTSAVMKLASKNNAKVNPARRNSFIMAIFAEYDKPVEEQANSRFERLLTQVVMTSSMAAVECGNVGEINSETRSKSEVYGAEGNTGVTHYAYVAAKTESEAKAWELSKEMDVPLAVICPGNLVIGEVLSSHLNATMRCLQGLLQSENKLNNMTDIAPVNVEDVVSAHVAAFEEEEAGKRYLCAEKMIPVRDFISIVEELYPSFPVASYAENKIVIGHGNERSLVPNISDLSLEFTPLANTVKAAVDSMVSKNLVSEESTLA